MSDSEFDRRKFHELVAGAFGGLVVGASLGCGGDKPPAGSAQGSAASPAAGETAAAKHACRGMNECKTQGLDGKNACAGQGTCATSKHHSCAGQNECKGLGGCGSTAGANECKTKGSCMIPMHEGPWEKARAHFEERMKKAGKTVGPAPAAPKAG